MLAPLTTGDRIPYRMRYTEKHRVPVPTFLVVTAVLGPGLYEVEYPDGHRETLRDS